MPEQKEHPSPSEVLRQWLDKDDRHWAETASDLSVKMTAKPAPLIPPIVWVILTTTFFLIAAFLLWRLQGIVPPAATPIPTPPGASFTPTKRPATSVIVPPTDTPVPPTDTPVPPTDTPVPPNGEESYGEITEEIKVHKSPGTAASVMDGLHPDSNGHVYIIINSDTPKSKDSYTWIHVCCGQNEGREGWVAASFVQDLGSAWSGATLNLPHPPVSLKIYSREEDTINESGGEVATVYDEKTQGTANFYILNRNRDNTALRILVWAPDKRWHRGWIKAQYVQLPADLTIDDLPLPPTPTP